MLDLDENGKVERRDFYRPDGKLDKVGFASRNDSVMDSQAFYTPAGEAASAITMTAFDDTGSGRPQRQARSVSSVARATLARQRPRQR